MIVKDEQNMLEDCLLSVQDLVNEIIIVDTGSSDNTISIAEHYGAKIFIYPWDGSFSNARNYSMAQAGCEWILLLDADERLVRGDEEKLLEFIRTTDLDGAHFKVYNYVGENNSKQYTCHSALRLIRNNNIYRFKGDIHEQITSMNEVALSGRFAITDIGIHHLGYLDSVVAQKDKRSRNLPLLLEELAREPENPFTLFNLGNEYMAQKDYRRALEFFDQARSYYSRYEAYAPHLLFRSAMCYYSLGLYADAIRTLHEGLGIFPGCTDMEFLKGLIYMDWCRDTLALESFEKAIAMGEPHPTLRFSDGCATIRPLLSMALIYERQHHYPKAADCYIKAIGVDNRLYSALYGVAKAWRQMMMEPADIEANLGRFFADLNHVPNQILLTDILLSQRLYSGGKKHLDFLAKAGGYEMEVAMLAGKYCFYTQDYEQACSWLKKALNCNVYPQVLAYAGKESALMLLAAILISKPAGSEDAREAVEAVGKQFGSPGRLVSSQILSILNGQEENLLEGEDPQELLSFFSQLLNLILDSGEFDLFEKVLYVYNYIDSPRVLLSLAAVYMESGFQQMAAAAVLRSIKEMNTIDAASARLLADTLLAEKCLSPKKFKSLIISKKS